MISLKMNRIRFFEEVANVGYFSVGCKHSSAMKHSLFFLFPILLSILGLPAIAIAQVNNGVTNAFTKRLETLLNQKEYFRLDKELKFFEEDPDEGKKLYYQCFV